MNFQIWYGMIGMVLFSDKVEQLTPTKIFVNTADKDYW